MTSKTAFLILKATEAPCPIMGRALLWLWGLFLKYYNIMKRNKQFLQELSLFLEQNFHLPITAKDAANALFLSPSRFSHVFHQHFGINFQKYLCQYRIHRAAAHYTDSALSIAEIAQAVGFSAKDAANAFQLVLLFYSLFVSRFPLRKSGCFLK